MTRRIQRAAGALAMIGIAAAGIACSREQAESVPWTVSEGKAPAEMPSDLPVYPNAKYEVGLTRRGGLVIWRTPDPLPAVQRYYMEQFRAKGWRVAAYPGGSGSWLGAGAITLIATNAAGRRVSMSLGTQEGSTAITALWHGKQAS